MVGRYVVVAWLMLQQLRGGSLHVAQRERDFYLDVALRIGIECLMKCTVELVHGMVIGGLIRQMVCEIDVL